MSKNIDFDNLSDDDRQYLVERPWIVEEYERQTGKTFDADSATSSSQSFAQADFDEAVRREAERLAAERLADDGTRPEPSPGDDGDDDESEDEDDYEDWEYNSLLEEVSARNEDREEDAKIKPSSRKAEDLIAALRADDEANA